ncbi:hypothetical protein [Paludisphaera mucosa]|uniref:Uncharacterized protein n=1 Tax=Paludisphaera mucosa TaxID=3030827 RepID=A0ABT6F6P3_9BACT|nr:hypothetical protein [Paludisphaera mucosa]MDG3003252.1 hypothetical protein [Paludisphaera mucosa]
MDLVDLVAEAERRLGMRKWEWARYTLTGLVHALRERDADPHAGNIPVESWADLDRLIGGR